MTNETTSGVQAHSTPDMWTPMTMFYTPNSIPGTVDGIREDIAISILMDQAGIGHKRIFFLSEDKQPRILHMIATADLPRLRDAFLAENAFADAIGTDAEDEVFSLMFDLAPADYRGGGKHRRKIGVYPPMAGNKGMPPVADDRQWLVERNVEWTKGTQPSYFIDMADNGTATAFAVLSDEETRNG